jgi:hypothetical protein
MRPIAAEARGPARALPAAPFKAELDTSSARERLLILDLFYGRLQRKRNLM